jgi:transposase
MEEVSVKNINRYPVYLMFQDKARFGRMCDPRTCWAPAPLRPVVNLALVREYEYVFGAVCPKTWHLDYMFAPNMKTENMSIFLQQVSKAHPNRFVIMVVDGASSHKGKELIILSNIALILLPPYSPELNPTERIWNVVRRDFFANRYFENLDQAIEQADFALSEIKSDRKALKSLTYWPWIDAIFNAN